MEIDDMAVMLGLRMKQEAIAQRFLKARDAYNACEELRTSFTEYNVQRMVLEEEANKEEIDNELVKHVDTRIDELFSYITSHPVYRELEEAEKALNDEIRRVAEILSAQITGQTAAGGCTHDCSTCGGCH